MNPLPPPDAATEAFVVAAGVCGRMAAAVVAGTLPVFPGASLQIRAVLAVALAVVAIPTAWAARAGAAAPEIGPLVPVVVGELLVGLLMGAAVAAVLAAASWAGGILGSVSGLSWADDFDPEPVGQNAGVGRLAWWIGLAAFFAAGGQLTVVAGLVDSVRQVPVGSLFHGRPGDWLETVALRTPAAGFSLAVMLALPALVAVVAFHLASGICLRTVPFAAGPGLVQGMASLVLLGCLWLGAEAWGGGGAVAMLEMVGHCFDGR